jgi:hypothetical protein
MVSKTKKEQIKEIDKEEFFIIIEFKKRVISLIYYWLDFDFFIIFNYKLDFLWIT